MAARLDLLCSPEHSTSNKRMNQSLEHQRTQTMYFEPSAGAHCVFLPATFETDRRSGSQHCARLSLASDRPLFPTISMAASRSSSISLLAPRIALHGGKCVHG